MSNTHVCEIYLQTAYKKTYPMFTEDMTTIILEIYVIKLISIMIKIKTKVDRKDDSCCSDNHFSECFITESNEKKIA